jgi:hypothetical protein
MNVLMSFLLINNYKSGQADQSRYRRLVLDSLFAMLDQISSNS